MVELNWLETDVKSAIGDSNAIASIKKVISSKFVLNLQERSVLQLLNDESE